MTANQIAYRNSVETARHNREMERLTGEAQSEQRRSNLSREAETNRSNLATEAETARANQARESLTHQTNVINSSHFSSMDAETLRTHMANEDIEKYRATEQARHNVASEYATQIANAISGRVAEVGAINAQTNAYQASINAAGVLVRSREAEIAQQEANTRDYEAETRRLSALDALETGAAQRKQVASQTKLNEQRTRESQANQKLAEERSKTESQQRLPGTVDRWANAINDIGSVLHNIGQSVKEPVRNLQTNLILKQLRKE